MKIYNKTIRKSTYSFELAETVYAQTDISLHVPHQKTIEEYYDSIKLEELLWGNGTSFSLSTAMAWEDTVSPLIGPPWWSVLFCFSISLRDRVAVNIASISKVGSEYSESSMPASMRACGPLCNSVSAQSIRFKKAI